MISILSFAETEKEQFTKMKSLYYFTKSRLNIWFLKFLLLLLVNYSCPYFLPITVPCPTHPHLPLSIPHPLVFVCGSFIHVP